MDLKKRKEYFIFTSIFWGIGFILYGGMAAAGKELLDIPLNTFLVFLLYGLGGSLLLGGLASGILLFSNFFKRQKLSVKIILCVFFPVTFLIICQIGILSLIPYGIYNFVIMKKDKETKEDKNLNSD